MNLIRKLKISEIVPVEFNHLELKIINLFNDKLLDLIVFINDSKPNEINYMKADGSFILQHNMKNDRLYVKYEGFFKTLHNDYHIKKIDLKNLLYFFIKCNLNIESSQIFITRNRLVKIIEKSYKYEIERTSNCTLNIK